MGRILANGEIVHDDEPQRHQRRPNQSRMGTVQHNDQNQQQQEGDNEQQGMVGQVSVLDTLNQRLVDNGFPRWNAGPYVVEPIVSVGFLFALLIAGFPGIIFAGLLFFVSKYSTEGNSNWWRGGGGGNGGNNEGGRTLGNGRRRRLGRPR